MIYTLKKGNRHKLLSKTVDNESTRVLMNLIRLFLDYRKNTIAGFWWAKPSLNILKHSTDFGEIG